MKNWIFRTPAQPDPAWADELALSPMLLALLCGRGYTEKDAIDTFLSPSLSLLAHPNCWPGIPTAAAMLADDLLAGKTLAVWGDYDVDGITATALVLDVLEAHNISALYHVPDRKTEGYGLNIPAIEALAAQGVQTLLTVDCGISDVQAIARARELGMRVILSDHHLPPAELPPASAICNPRMGEPEQCPCPHLAGVGVAFYLMGAVNALLHTHLGTRCVMDNVLDLVALGTLADVMRLSGQNRLLVKGGLRRIAMAQRPGMAALKRVSNFDEAAAITSGQAVFRLAPRINAAGRMGHAGLALALLRAKSREEAQELATQLDALNSERRLEEERIGKEARDMALRQIQEGRMGLVLYGKDWHAGIIGIVASRIVDEFYRPTLILCDDQQAIKGSGRSVREFDLHAGLTRISQHMLGYGGHKQAAGVRIAPDTVATFAAAFDAVVREELGSLPLTPTIMLECELGFELASSFDFLKELELLQPFGPGNAEPVFASPPLLVTARQPLGRGHEHVRLRLLDEHCGIALYAKAWRMGAQMPESLCGKKICIAYTPKIDSYNGTPTIDINIKDWKMAEDQPQARQEQ
jgi:single-stranded-DNA-specific exonuclease